MVPLLAPAIFASALLVFSGVIDDFVIVDLLSSSAGNTPMSVPNEDAAGWSQGTPVHVHLPADALRVLAGGAEPAPADAEAAVAS